MSFAATAHFEVRDTFEAATETLKTSPDRGRKIACQDCDGERRLPAIMWAAVTASRLTFFVPATSESHRLSGAGFTILKETTPMSGTLTHSMDTLHPYTLASEPMMRTGSTIAAGTSPTTVVLGVVTLLVTISLTVMGWKILAERSARNRTADVTNSDLNALITELRDADVETRRLQALPGPACGDDFKELTRLVPRVESLGAQCAAPLPMLVSDVVQDLKNLIALPVDNSTPFGEYGVRVQQQTRAVDKLLVSIDKALTSAREMRS